MITIRNSKDRGYADHGWLKSHHTFSFAHYYDPKFMNYSQLRVLNQDRVAPTKGFGTHGHDNMEIVSFVLDGKMEHKDSMGNGSQMVPGDIQLMSAGTGVTHSEFNASDSDELHFLQMWVLPSEEGYKPRYDQKHFDTEKRRGKILKVISPDGADGTIQIGQDAYLYTGLFDGDEQDKLELKPNRRGWFHLAEGSLELNGQKMQAGDGAAIEDETSLEIKNGENAQFVLWDLPVN